MRSVLLFAFICLALSATSQNPWTLIQEPEVITKHNGERSIVPTTYQTLTLDFDLLKKRLKAAPMENIRDTKQKGVKIQLPDANGEYQTFWFSESPAMSEVLSAKYPAIKAYRGMTQTGTKAWIDLGPRGFRGVINDPTGTMYIDPYYDNISDSQYIVYYVSDHKRNTADLPQSCGVMDYEHDIEEELMMRLNTSATPRGKAGSIVTKTTYRFALACTGAWGSQQGGTIERVLERMNTGTNRLNSLLEDEMAVKLVLVDNNDQLIFFNSNEPYTSVREGRELIQQNPVILNNIIGSQNYDVGHVFTINCSDVGGIAALASVCTARKGAGVSCVGNANLDRFMVGTTAHEIGHQFNAAHTMNSCIGQEENVNTATGCEIGSGKTIMSYFGGCGASNLSGQEVSLYHVCTMDRMLGFVAEGSGNTCGVHEPSDNHNPDVWIEKESGFTIPRFTPFELTGEASDMDDDNMSYTWEQIDVDFTSADVGTPVGNSPLFIYKEPTQNKTRLFPRLSDILAGRDSKEERLPNYSRDLTFSFVARDDNPVAGGIGWATIAFKATETAGPFTVTSPSTLTTAGVGEELAVEWNVANTDGDLVNCQYVDIYFSGDNAQSFPILLLPRTPNDGSETIRLPYLPTQNGKIKVKASNSIWFNVNRNSIRIEEPTEPGFYLSTPDNKAEFCLPGDQAFTLQGQSFMGFSESINLEVIDGLPADASYTFSQNPMPADGSTILDIDMNNLDQGGVYNVVVRATAPGADTVYQTISILTKGSYMGDLALTSPESGTTGLATIPKFTWNKAGNGTGYRIQVATNPAFGEEDLLIDKEVGDKGEAFEVINLENSTIYYWRVVAYNACTAETYSEVNVFSSPAFSCQEFAATDLPLNITASGTPTITSKIEILEDGTAADVNVKLIRGNHNYLPEVRASLISPSGTRAILWQGLCTNVGTINAGFDSQSVFPNSCPNRDGDKVQPLETLDIFNNESIRGEWAFEIWDTESGNGGTITDFELEICANSVLNTPYIVNNEILMVPIGGGNKVYQESLLTADDDNGAEELIYTLIQIPTKGILELSNSQLVVGDHFSQTDLNTGKLRYQHNGTDSEEDQFVFTVEDGNGGYVDKTIFTIVTDENAPSDINEIADAGLYFQVYPNPTDSWIHVTSTETSNENWSIEITNAAGKKVATHHFNHKIDVPVSHLNAGLYLLTFDNGKTRLNKKISIVR